MWTLSCQALPEAAGAASFTRSERCATRGLFCLPSLGCQGRVRPQQQRRPDAAMEAGRGLANSRSGLLAHALGRASRPHRSVARPTDCAPGPAVASERIVRILELRELTRKIHPFVCPIGPATRLITRRAGADAHRGARELERGSAKTSRLSENSARYPRMGALNTRAGLVVAWR